MKRTVTTFDALSAMFRSIDPPPSPGRRHTESDTESGVVANRATRPTKQVSPSRGGVPRLSDRLLDEFFRQEGWDDETVAGAVA
jgi:hypothetical protein